MIGLGIRLPALGRRFAVSGDADLRAAVLADSPVGYWRCNDSDEPPTQLADETGDWPMEAAGLTYGEAPLAAGAGGTSIKLNGTNSLASADGIQSRLNGATAATIEAWVRRASSGDRVVVGFSTTGLFRFEFILESDGNLWTIIENGGSAAAYGFAAAAGTAVRHVVMAYNAALSGFDRVKLCVNGAAVTLDHQFSNAVPAALAADLGPFYLGREVNNGQWSAGWVDEAALYTKALSATRAAAHYNLGA